MIETLINTPLLTLLSFSGGKQSSALLWMVILGIIEKPKNFVVLNADPGMENSGTYKYIDMMMNECTKNGIEFYTVDGPNLYLDMVNLSTTSKIRFDTPPYWTKNKQTRKLGRLKQTCTLAYKIHPMDRKLRILLEEKFGISRKSKRIGNDMVEKWIGFTYTEIERVKPSQRKYYYFRYPLIEMKMSNQDVIDFFVKYKLPIPSRSVCNACFANGLNTLKEMYHNRPEDWKQAVNVDNSIRDWSQIGIRDEVYVSQTLIPLEKLAEVDFDVSKIGKDLENEYSCDSGYCFL